MSIIIIKEDITDNLEIIKEGKNGVVKNHYIEGVFLQADVKNRNGRYYPLEVTEKAVQRYNEEYIKTGRSLGELGHPSDGGGINLHLASHKIESLEKNGKNFIGKAKLLDTPMGKIAKTLIDEGVRLGVSLRGYGSVQEKNGMNVVGPNFTLSTVDIVADPSAPDAFVQGIMENTEKYFKEGILLEQDYSYIQHIFKAEKVDEDKMLKLFENIMSNISKK